jgi:glycosyltransferase involved in cell wall biosynthesis
VYGFCGLVKKDLTAKYEQVKNDEEVIQLLNASCSDLLAGSDFIFAISSREELLLHKIVNNKRLLILPEMREPVPEEKMNSFDQRRNAIVYVGGFSHHPNILSAKILINEIFPKVKAEVPDAELYIIGNSLPPEISNAKIDGVKITGFVQDLSPYYNSAKVAAAPIVVKGGIKGKIIEALNYCTPVVASSLGIEGMDLKDGEDILIADASDDFAKKIVNLFKDKDLWNRISTNGKHHFLEHNSSSLVESILRAFLTSITQEGVSKKLGAASEITQRYGVDEPLAVLLLLYNERMDLQNAFPEAKSGQYKKLIQWAGSYGVTTDSQKEILFPYKDWYCAASAIQSAKN